jgi:heme O synthase-like polyprenyltransferase
MSTTGIPLSRLLLASRPSLVERLPHFATLMKPRVMALALFTALVGLMIAPIRLDLLTGFVAILTIAAGAGAAGALIIAAIERESPEMRRGPEEDNEGRLHERRNRCQD